MRFECAHADTCLPDYWSGHRLPHLQVPVYPGMTLKALKDALKSELRQGAIAGSNDDARLLSADLIRPDEEKRADQLTRAAYAAINRIRLTKRGKLFADLPDDEDGDSVYAFFIFVKI